VLPAQLQELAQKNATDMVEFEPGAGAVDIYGWPAADWRDDAEDAGREAK